jgi:riboflavin kinase/FMN adenylyltransferase
VISGERVPLLTTIDERAELAAALGVERMVVVPFTREVASLEPEEYVRQILMDGVGVREAVVGFDHHFGRARRGNRALLEELGRKHGFTVDVIPEQVAAGATVSSRRVRQLLLETGDVRAAAVLLGRDYSFDALVVPGDGRGRTIGYPTANLEPADPRKIIPAAGVYAVRVDLAAGRTAGGMMNVGRRPTFEGDGAMRAEVHLFDVEEDLYGRRLRVGVVDRLRDERRFGGIDELREQLGRDEGEARMRLAV